MSTTKRLSLEEFKAKKVELHGENLDYLTGGAECGDCLPCENFCHDAIHNMKGNGINVIEDMPSKLGLANYGAGAGDIKPGGGNGGGIITEGQA